MAIDRVKFQETISSLVPEYVRDDFPLLVEFLEEYYVSQETQGATMDLVQNLDLYVKVDELYNLNDSTILQSDIGYTDTTISASVEGNFTYEFPSRNGLLQIDNEIISYDNATQLTFEGCKRGFSGITSYFSPNSPDQLLFQSSKPAPHKSGAIIYNLQIRFLKEFFKKIKNQFLPGFDERELFSGINQRNLIFGAQSFYSAKGTETAFEVLFKALYGKEVEVIKPSEFLFRPSDAQYSVTRDFVIEQYVGNPLDLENLTVYQNTTGARGTVTNVEKINYGDKYYQISIDYGYARDIDVDGTIFGKFEPNAKTKLSNDVSIGSTVLNVDSTVSFGSTGSLSVYDIDGIERILEYSDKTLTQFIGVTTTTTTFSSSQDVRDNNFSYGFVGINTSDQVKFKITSTLTDLKINEEVFSYKKGDNIEIKSIGIDRDSYITNIWKNNIRTQFDVETVILNDITERTYTVKTYNDLFFSIGYRVKLIDRFGRNIDGEVRRIIDSKTVVISFSTIVPGSSKYVLENEILYGRSAIYPELGNYYANVLNNYTKFDGDVLIASNSIPNYNNENLDPYDKKVVFTGSADGEELVIAPNSDHGFYDGDPIYYLPKTNITTTTTSDGVTITTEEIDKFTNLSESIYFAKRVSPTTIKLALSQSDLFDKKFVTPLGDVTDNSFIYYNFYQKKIEPQKIYREITTPSTKSGDYLTSPGYNGIFVNGVELLNYKSSFGVSYGDIKSISVDNRGSGYDVINPPILSISDTVGTGATGIVSVDGSLEEIRIINGGFDYIDTPIVEISGGEGTGAEAFCQLTFGDHIVPFNADNSTGVQLFNNRIGFTTDHKFRQDEAVIYQTNGSQAVSGIVTDSLYYVNIIDEKTVSLHFNPSDSNSGTNPVNLTALGKGVHDLRSFNKKSYISNIIINNSGSGYKNKLRNISSVGVNTALNQLNIDQHGYETGETVLYTPGDSPISGISSNTEYFVNKINGGTFSLSEIGTGNTDRNFYLNNNIDVNITSTGNGSFNYKPITVNIVGQIGVATVGSQTVESLLAKVQPIFRGVVDSINISSGGVGYGSSEIINFERQPSITLLSGDEAQVTPIVNSEGVIVSVIVNNRGSNYNSPPNLIISDPKGKYCQLTPIVSGGQLIEVLVINGGIDYSSSATIRVESAGSGAIVRSVINNWTINLFERNFSRIKDDDGFVNVNISNNSLEYSHIYPARKLRESLYSTLADGSPNYSAVDLNRVNGTEVNSSFHSPIVGWAYDGNPIYGPYAYGGQSGGSVRQMKSGYTLKLNSTNRPSTSDYPLGFFVEDYIFDGSGDLDIHNGRFCVTPEFPNGTYAYFCTFEFNVDSSGPFVNFKRPVFPYVIGNSLRSEPNNFNYLNTSNHSDYDIQSNGWFRNTHFYNLYEDESGYQYIFNSDRIKKLELEVKSVSKGGVSSVGIITAGNSYKVGDRIAFNNEGTSGSNAAANVSRIKGRSVRNVNVNTTTINNIEFRVIDSSSILGICSEPHNLKNLNKVQINGLSDYFKGLDGSYTIGVSTGRYTSPNSLDTISNTGIITYVSFTGDASTITSNDVLIIEDEKLLVLNIDSLNSRLRVLRGYDGTTGVAHSSYKPLNQDSRRFTIETAPINSERTLNVNKEIYFNPTESLGVGTVGSATTINFSNPGVGRTFIHLNDQQIYLPNHGFSINEQVEYDTNSGGSIQVWDGNTGSAYEILTGITSLFTVPLSQSLIGISTNKVGQGTDGSYVGLNSGGGLLYFVGVGTGVNHSFTTLKNDVLKGSLEQNIVTVSLASTHGLSLNDKIEFSIKPRDEVTVVVKYNDYNRRIVFDPIDFTSGDVDITNNTIEFTNNDFRTGDKVIHTSSSPSGGLVDQGIYYIYKYSNTKVQLVSTRVELSELNPNFVDITSASSGTLSKINPYINIYQNNILKFDLSDSSLSFVSNAISYSAFDLNLYTDNQNNNIFFTSGKTPNFEVTKSGRVGIDTTANLRLVVSDFIPPILWYKFENNNVSFSPNIKKEIIIDEDVTAYSQLIVSPTELDGEQVISGIGTDSFEFDLSEKPSTTSYTSSTSIITYDTNSTSTDGPISSIEVTSSGRGYKESPGITSVISSKGNGCILSVETTGIGNILSYEYKSNYIGFDFPTDQTLRAVANLPEIIEFDPYVSLGRIGISSNGVNYLVAPNLLIFDGLTGIINNDVQLDFELGDTQVTILKNSTTFNNVTPRIVPTDNTNGVRISSLTYNEVDSKVRLLLDTTYVNDSDYPFSINEQIMVENVNIGIGTTGKGYNSSQYNYDYFTVVGVNTAAGGVGAYVEYSLSEFLKDDEIPGNVVSTSGAVVVPVKDMPVFDIELIKNNYFVDETITNGTDVGVIQSWNRETETAKVLSKDYFKVGDDVRGLSSKNVGRIKNITVFDAEINTGSGTTVINGWQRDTGFFNEDSQRIPNNEYYQNFSYSLKSEIPFEKWNDAVGALNHTAGFQKYSDLQIISRSEGRNLIVVPEETGTDVEATVDITSFGQLNCFPDFDNASESHSYINGKIFSNSIIFQNKIITDYFQSVGNRVLSIDDISSQFNSSNLFGVVYVDVFDFPGSSIFTKQYNLVQDTFFTGEIQFSIFSYVLNTKSQVAYTNEIAKVYSESDLGYFDYASGSLRFYPVKSSFNSYSVNTFGINVLNNVTSVGSTQLGDVASLFSTRTTTNSGVTDPIVSISSTYRSLKVYTVVEDEDSDVYSAELTVLQNNSDIEILEYGNIQSIDDYSPGIGTYGARLSGGNLIVEFHPNVSTALTSNTSVIAISDTGTSIGSCRFFNAEMHSEHVSIASSTSPTATVIESFDRPYIGGYHFVTVKDTTNNLNKVLEVSSLDARFDAYFSQYGHTSEVGFGTVGIQTTSTGIELLYTPIPNSAQEINTFSIIVGPDIVEDGSDLFEMDNVVFNSHNNFYEGSQTGIKKDFPLSHKGSPIFSRKFDATDDTIVDIDSNVIKIPNHYFVSGEELVYSSNGRNIGIETANIPGIGNTTFLPDTVYVVKVDDGNLRFASTPENALLETPSVLIINSVGVGNSHKLTSQNRNSKAIVAIDNMIQSPISNTKVTTSLTEESGTSPILNVTGITSFFSGDLVLIDDEVIYINNVNSNNNTISGYRGQLGTKIVGHTNGSTVTKISGQYNIIDSQIYFVDPPYGNTPIPEPDAIPDERDWTGITTSSTFQGRVFLKRAGTGTTLETYNNNYVIDDISSQFTGIKSDFTIQSDGSDITGITTNAVVLINGIFQQPVSPFEVGYFEISEDLDVGISTIKFQGDVIPEDYDINKGSYPIGGVIVSVGSTEGLGYQPLISAGGTAIVSTSGTITSISIGNSGSGYRSGVQVVNVGVQTYSGVIPNIEFIGTATVDGGHVVSIAITNPGSGYTSTNAPVVVFDDPLPYSNIELEYSSSSSGIGQGAKANIVVGNGSSVIDFEITAFGFGYGNDQVLTVPIGGSTGIPTDSSYTFKEFELTIEKIYTDKFNSWSIGEFEVIDNLDDKFNGVTRSFNLTINDSPVSIQSQPGSNIELDQTLLVFINDVLQEPGKSYEFNGGSLITFAQPPNGQVDGVEGSGDSCRILFYKGAGAVDVEFTDILESVKVGDTLKLSHNSDFGQSPSLDQKARVITGINTIDSVGTNNYPGPGVTSDTTLLRPVEWCKQIEDKFINGVYVNKDRVDYEPLISPSAFLIQPVGTTTSFTYVDSVRPLFNSENESDARSFQNSITIVNQDPKVGASATAIVSIAGTISLDLLDGGLGYDLLSSTSITIGSPEDGTKATATATVDQGIVTKLEITNPGSGYTNSQPPEVLIQPPSVVRETISVNSYSGDYGLLVGFGITNQTGINSDKNQVIFDLYIPTNSFMREDKYVGTGITVSGISTGDFLSLYSTNVSLGSTIQTVESLYNDNETTLGITTVFVDGVFQVESAYTTQVNVIGVGTTSVRRIFCNTSGISTISFGSSIITFDSSFYTFDNKTFEVYGGGITTSYNFGKYSWGKIEFGTRSSGKSFPYYGLDGTAGLGTGGLVTRTNTLRYNNYT